MNTITGIITVEPLQIISVEFYELTPMNIETFEIPTNTTAPSGEAFNVYNAGN